MFLAVNNNHPVAVSVLLEAGASPCIPDFQVCCRHRVGDCMSHIHAARARRCCTMLHSGLLHFVLTRSNRHDVFIFAVVTWR